MTITCHHPASSRGIPVILSDGGDVLDYGPGLTAVLERLKWSRCDFARECGYKGPRSVEKFWQGTIPPAATLNLLGVHLAHHQARQEALRSVREKRQGRRSIPPARPA